MFGATGLSTLDESESAPTSKFINLHVFTQGSSNSFTTEYIHLILSCMWRWIWCGAQLPFAMMRLSPDTAFDNIALEWRHFGGYYYGELGEDGTLLVRFSHSPVLVAVLQFSSGQWSHTNALFSQCLINRMATTSTLGNILTSILIFLQVIMRFVASLTPIWWALGWRIMGTLVSW